MQKNKKMIVKEHTSSVASAEQFHCIYKLLEPLQESE